MVSLKGLKPSHPSYYPITASFSIGYTGKYSDPVQYILQLETELHHSHTSQLNCHLVNRFAKRACKEKYLCKALSGVFISLSGYLSTIFLLSSTALLPNVRNPFSEQEWCWLSALWILLPCHIRDNPIIFTLNSLHKDEENEKL